MLKIGIVHKYMSVNQYYGIRVRVVLDSCMLRVPGRKKMRNFINVYYTMIRVKFVSFSH